MTPEEAGEVMRVRAILLRTCIHANQTYLYGDEWVRGSRLAELVAREIVRA